jgi:hypothetical protein
MHRLLLVDHKSLRVAAHADDGLYSLRRMKGHSHLLAYLERFLANPVAMERLHDLLEEFDPDLDTDPLEDEEIIYLTADHVRHGRIDIAEVVERYHPVNLLDNGDDPAPIVPPPSPIKPTALTWIELKFFDERSAKPVRNLRIVLKTPDGNQSFRTTDAEGLIRVDSIDPGSCDAWCEAKGAKMDDTLAYAGDGQVPATEENSEPLKAGTLWRINNIESHKVKTGESLDSLAKKAGITWQDLAKFNWATDVPDEINTHLRWEVGCRHKTADKKNYIFHDDDDPGIILIPSKWEEMGLPTTQMHVFRVNRPKPQFAFEFSV